MPVIDGGCLIEFVHFSKQTDHAIEFALQLNGYSILPRQ
jgi:hypothetical protein